jgi:hypothetical protein
VVHSDLPLSPLHQQIPVQVLQSRFVTYGSSQVKQVMVKWSSMSADLATWEDAKSWKQKFQCSPAWGQTGVQAKGNGNVATTCQGLSKETHRRSNRPSKPNLKYDNPDWMKPMVN